MNSGTILGFATASSAASGVVPMPMDSHVITSSMTYKAPVSGTLLIRAIAADGSGGVSSGGCATGAGAGESADKAVQVSAGDEYVITIGAGGAAVTRSTTGSTNGNDGGDTAITGPNVAMTVKGGKGGKAGPVSAGTPLLGGLGGDGGTGGDVHRPGGRGGDIANCATQGATGGGAVNFSTTLTQAATRGGDVLGVPTGPYRTGGGGIRGRGGDLTAPASTSSSGGGAYGNAIDGANTAGTGGPNIIGQRTAGTVTLISAAADPFGLDFASGNGASSSNAAGNGGGGGGADFTPGAFGGCGAVSGLAGVVQATTTPFYGAPSGYNIVSGTGTGLKGRDGVVFLRIYPRA